MNNRSTLLKAYAKGHELLTASLSKVPEEALDYKPHAEAWSIREIVHHIADSEAFGYIRCRKIIAENGRELSVYDQNEWARELDYSVPLDDALEFIRIGRKMTSALLAKVTDEVWMTHASIHPEDGSLTLDDWLVKYVHHIERHLLQIERNMTHWNARQ